MLNVYLVLDLVVVIALLALGGTVLIKNKSVELNQTFALFVLSIGIWIIANYISNDTDYSAGTAVTANYFVFLFSFAASVFLLQFVIGLANDTKSRKILHKAYIPLTLIGLTGATPLVVAGASLQGQVYAVHFGILSPLYFVTLIANIVLTVVITKRNIKRTQGDQKNRLQLLFRSLCLTFPVLLLAQAIVPALTGWFGLTNIGVLPMLILVYGLYYGVVKHRLFDLRPVVVKATAYAVTVGVIAVFYGVTSYYITTLISQAHSSLLGGFLNVILIISAVTIYSPTKKVFDRVTNKFFYQDAYDAQDLFDELNRTLVSSLDIRYLMDQSAYIIASHLKSQFCIVGLRSEELGYRYFGSKDHVALNEHIDEIINNTSRAHDGVIIADNLDQPNVAELQDILQKNSISVLVRLNPNGKKNQKGLGYIFLGAKQSGGPYNIQDKRVLDTVTNELIIAIQNALHFEEIQRFNDTLQKEVANATRQLRETNAELRKVDRQKDEFIGMASHQLRTPLTSIKGYVSLVLDGDSGRITATQRKLLEQAFTSSQRMVYLIADLLNVSRLKSGKFVIERAPTNLAKVISDEMAQLKTAASTHNVELTFTPPESFPMLMLDETKTRQVIMNFLDNAIYYTPSGGHIHVVLRDLPKSIEFEVDDDGIGVPKAERHHLFTKFYRAKNAQRARPDGTGLGLFMAQKVIIAQGGAIIFDSKEGVGSQFGFSFPKEMPDDSGAPIVITE